MPAMAFLSLHKIDWSYAERKTREADETELQMLWNGGRTAEDGGEGGGRDTGGEGGDRAV